jgi:hypothetical protein
MILFVWLTLALGLAEAKQTKHSVQKSPDKWSFVFAWTDPEGRRHKASFKLDASLIKQDIEEPLRFQRRKAAEYQAKKVRQWGKKQKGVKIGAKAEKGRVTISASGKPGAIKEGLKGAKEVRDRALGDYMDEYGYTYYRPPFRLRKGIVPDYLRHVEEYSDDLMPVVDALGGPTKDPRVFANKALSFVQNIPYELRALKSDRYRRPLSVIGRNKGDCDSKTVLFLSLMHAAYPKLDLGVVYVRKHAFGALGLEPERGETRFRNGGEVWVGVEPVGPAVAPIGKLGFKSKLKLKTFRYRLRTI